MRVEFHTRRGVSGEVFLHGVAVGSHERMQRFLDKVTIIEPNTFVTLTPDMGERYLRALPATLSGSYVAAVLVEPETPETDEPPRALDVDAWPCALCGHGHRPGRRCGERGCDCRA